MKDDFDGETYDRDMDRERLKGQLDRVKALVLGSYPKWWTLEGITRELNLPPSSIPAVSARLRDLRKEKFGSYNVESQRVVGGNGLWEYRVGPPVEPDPPGQLPMFEDDP